MTAGGAKGRAAYLDFLRVLAAFLVIVNHTNSRVFQALTPANGAWYLSVLWYYVSKTAVPLFVMISGACLLGKADSYGKVAWRFARVLLALLLFSYAYYLYDAWVYYGLWPRAGDLATFFGKVWRGEITDGFWYLYFYLGMLLLLPFWQRMAKGMERRDYHYLLAVTFGFGAAWPLWTHYMPQAALPAYFDLPLLSSYVGLFFLGQYIHRYLADGRVNRIGGWAKLLLALGASVLLTRLEFDKGVAKYWFMDDRTLPSILTIIAAGSIMSLAKLRFAGKKSGKALASLGGCAFAVYLLQDLVIAETKNRVFAPLCGVLPSFVAALAWEALAFAVCLAVSWALTKIPGLRRVL